MEMDRVWNGIIQVRCVELPLDNIVWNYHFISYTTYSNNFDLRDSSLQRWSNWKITYDSSQLGFLQDTNSEVSVLGTLLIFHTFLWLDCLLFFPRRRRNGRLTEQWKQETGGPNPNPKLPGFPKSFLSCKKKTGASQSSQKRPTRPLRPNWPTASKKRRWRVLRSWWFRMHKDVSFRSWLNMHMHNNIKFYMW